MHCTEGGSLQCLHCARRILPVGRLHLRLREFLAALGSGTVGAARTGRCLAPGTVCDPYGCHTVSEDTIDMRRFDCAEQATQAHPGTPRHSGTQALRQDTILAVQITGHSAQNAVRQYMYYTYAVHAAAGTVPVGQHRREKETHLAIRE
jgi:hypothetical protein